MFFNLRAKIFKRQSEHQPIIVVVSNLLSKVVIVLSQLILARILLEVIGVDGYAIFALLLGLQGWFMLADLGIGSSVQNGVSKALAHNHSTKTLTAFGNLYSVALLVLTIFGLYFVSPLLGPWFLKKFITNAADATNLFFVTGAFCIGTTIGGVVYKTWYAMRLGYISNLLPACAALIGLAGVKILSWQGQEHSMIAYISVFLGPTAIIPLLVLFVCVFRDGIPSKGLLMEKTKLKEIVRNGLGFWFFSLAAALTLQVDYLVMSQIMQASDITLYSLMMKIFGLPFFIYTAFLAALWPIITESAAIKNSDNIKKYINSGILMGVSFLVIFTIALIWFMDDLILLLAPKWTEFPPAGLIVLMGFYWILRSWTDTFAVTLQSMNRLGLLISAVPIQGFLSLGLQYLLTPYFGLYGILMGLIGSFLLTVSWLLPIYVYKYIKNMTEIQ